MALIKIGTKTIDGVENGVYLLQGNATRDGELKDVNGKDLGKCSVAAKELNDGGTMFVSLSGWRQKASDVAAIRKMDSVLAVGTLRKREHNDRTYWDLDVDFVTVSGVGGSRPSAAGYDEPESDFTQLDEDDGELPF